MGGRGGSAPATREQAPAVTTSPRQLFSDDVSLPLNVRVAVALEELRRSQGLDREDFLKISDVHDKLTDIPTDVLNRTLQQMGSQDRSVTLNPQSNQKILTPRQHATAVNLGNERKHLIKLMPRGRDALLR